MTASPLSPTGTRARTRTRPPRRVWRRLAIVAGFYALMLLAPVFSVHAQTETPIKGDIKVTTDGGYLRLAFRFEKEVPASIQTSYPIIIVTFKNPVAVSIDQLSKLAPDYISAARLDPDGTSIRIAVRREVKVNSIPFAERLYIDLLPSNWTGIMPGLPHDVVEELANRALEAERQLRKQRFVAKTQTPSSIRVKVATQPTFTRFIFPMPDLANVMPDRSDGKLTLEFDQPIKWDLADAQAALPPTLHAIDTEVEDDSMTVTFKFNGNPEVRSFREDRSIVVDVGRDGGKLKQPAAEAAVPAITPPDTVPAKDAASESAKNTDAPAATSTPEKTAEAPPAAMPAPATAEAAPDVAKKVDKPAAVEAKPPAPNPDAPVIVTLRASGDTLRADFPFNVTTPAAVFTRGDMLWLVFDSAAKLDIGALNHDTSHALRSATLDHGTDGIAIVRVKLERPRLVGLETDSRGWVVTIGDSVTAPSWPLAIVRNNVGKNRASITIPFDKPSKFHMLTDLDGDRLMVVTSLGPTRGFLKDQNFVELRALPSTHGVVLQPLADDLVVNLSVDKILVTRPGGLSLSAATLGQQQLAGPSRATSFETQRWDFDRKANFSKRQSELMQNAAMAPLSKRKQARFSLARFYLAQGMSAEAKAVLDVALADKHASEDITGSVLKAVADVMLERHDAALKELSNPLIGNQLDATVWRGIAYAGQDKWPQARAAFKNVDNAISAMPLDLQRLALRNALRTAIEVQDFNGADRISNEIESIGVPPDMKPVMDVLAGRLNEALGRKELALARYHAAAESRDRRAAASGRLREIVLSVTTGDLTRKEAIHELELLTTIWRGDEIEAEGLALLAHLYTLENRYRDALHTWRVALLTHPYSDFTRKIQDEASVTFEALFLGGKADALPPVEALGMFYDYRDLTPIGRRGDEMIRRLSDRLISVDLLDQAAELLQHQVDRRLQGAARAQVATRLAVIYLMNRKPDRALATLQATRTADLSNELRDQRLLLEARALSESGRHDLALELIANLTSHEAMRLRADILWAARRWRAAAEQIELLYGDRWREFTPLNESERFDILRGAIGYSLGEEPIGLARFRERYFPKMADTPDRRAFDVVSAPVGSASTDFQEIAKKIAGIDSLDAFLRDMRTRYPGSSAISPGASNQVAPPATPAKPKDKTSQSAAPEKAAVNTPAKPDAVATPPKALAAPPAKADQEPTGSISRGPRAGAR